MGAERLCSGAQVSDRASYRLYALQISPTLRLAFSMSFDEIANFKVIEFVNLYSLPVLHHLKSSYT